MNVAHFSSQFDLVGGIENHVRAQLPVQARSGAPVRVYVVSQNVKPTHFPVSRYHRPRAPADRRLDGTIQSQLHAGFTMRPKSRAGTPR